MSTPSSIQSHNISEHRVLLIDTLNKVLRAFCSHTEKTFDEVMDNAMQLISYALGCSQICVDRRIEVDGLPRQMRVYHWSKAEGGAVGDGSRLLRLDKQVDKWVAALEKGENIYKKYSEATAVEKAFFDTIGVKLIIIIPIFTHGRFWGNVIFQDSDREPHIDEGLLDLIQSFAQLCANAVIRNEMLLEIVRQNDINKKIARDAAAAEERTRIMLDAFPLCCQLWTRDFETIDCNKTALELFGSKSKKEFIENFFTFLPEFQPDGRVSWEVVQKNVLIAFEEGHCAFDFMYILSDDTSLPVEITLERVNYQDDHVVACFTRDLSQIKIMESDILRLESESEKIYYDALTGIFNRRYFDENLGRAINTLSRSKGILSLMMIDIDYFKSFNDSYGHSTGDECLRNVAETLSNNASRAGDFVARYGGDEFAIVLPNTDENGARMIAGKILDSIRNCCVFDRNGERTQTITASIGVATGKVQQRHRPDDFMLRADELLYKSKQNGRDQYTFGKM